MPGTLITSEIDFSLHGKRSGYLRIPHSTRRSAYGWIPVPVTSIRNGDGPTLLLMAGSQGDEYEGQIAITKLARELQPGDIQGRVILMPVANVPATMDTGRGVPLDEGNLNRIFPGDPQGTPTQMIAHFIESVILPLCGYMVDLHTGGASLFYPPTLLRGKGDNPDETAKLMKLQQAFDLPYAWVFTSGGGRYSSARTAMGAANRKGVVSVMAELGGGGAVSTDILDRTERGLRRILHTLGILPGYTPDDAHGTREVNSEGLVYARNAGLFEPFKDIGDDVAKGETTGLVHDPDNPGLDPVEVASSYEGIILAKRAIGHVSCGDAVYQIARDADDD